MRVTEPRALDEIRGRHCLIRLFDARQMRVLLADTLPIEHLVIATGASHDINPVERT